MVRFKRPGIAIPTALFLALVVYFLSTVLTWQAQMNQRFTSGEAERAHHSFATRGEVNLFVANLMQDPNYADNHTASNPVEETVDGFKYHTWAQPTSDPKVLQIVCEVEGKLVPFKTCRSVVKTIAQGMILYTDIGPLGGLPELYSMKMDEPPSSWSPIPLPTYEYYVDTTLTDPITNAVTYDTTNHVLKTMPGAFTTFAAYGIGPNGSLVAIFEPPDINSPTPPRGYPTMYTYDQLNGTWGTPEEITGGYVPTGAQGARLGGTDGSLVIQDADGLLVRNPGDPDFTRVPNPPGGNITTSTSGNGSIYAQMTDGSLQVYNGTSWSSLVSPNGDYFTPTGDFVAGTGPVAVSQLSVSPNGSITALWQRNGVDTVFRYVPGDAQDPAHWDPSLPVTIEDPNAPCGTGAAIPVVSDIASITAMPGRFLTESAGPPQEVFVGNSKLSSPNGGPNFPVIATGIYNLPDWRYYPASYSTF